MWEFGASLLAQASGGADGVVGILDYRDLGVLGFFAVALMKMWVVPREYLTRVEAQLEKKEKELQDLRTKLDQEVLPQLWRTTDLLAQFATKIEDGPEKKA